MDGNWGVHLKALNAQGPIRKCTRVCLSPSQSNSYIPMPHHVMRQVGSLSAAALKHVNSIDRSPGTPYRRTLAPAERTALQQQLAKKLQQMSARLKEEDAAKAADAPGSSLQTGDSPSAAGAASSSAEAIPLSLSKRPHSLAGSRPGTASIPLHDMVMQRPSSRGMLGSSSWSGPLSALAEQQQQQQRSMSRLGTPMAGSQRVMNPLLRQSTPAGIGSGGQRARTPQMAATQQRPGTSPATAVRRQNTLTQFVPSRGLLYSVFQV